MQAKASTKRAKRYRVASHAGVGSGKMAPNEWLIESEQSFVNCRNVLAVMPSAQHPAPGDGEIFRCNDADAMGELLHKIHLNAGANIGITGVPCTKPDLPE